MRALEHFGGQTGLGKQAISVSRGPAAWREVTFFTANPLHAYMKMKAAVVAATALLFAAPALGAASRDGAVIRNSGSTNFAGFTIKVWSDGAASTAASNRIGSVEGPARNVSIAPTVAQKLLADLKAARDGHATGRPCMKSASFGYRLNVQWHGWTSPDLSCPGGDALTQALTADVRSIQEATGAGAGPPRRLLPNEPRLNVPEATPATTSTP
ncbi:MAG: hypothetical protein ACXVAR_07860 [Vulcanimicrobiaceae bacterium]